jgi:hypothetical protein
MEQKAPLRAETRSIHVRVERDLLEALKTHHPELEGLSASEIVNVLLRSLKIINELKLRENKNE